MMTTISLCMSAFTRSDHRNKICKYVICWWIVLHRVCKHACLAYWNSNNCLLILCHNSSLDVYTTTHVLIMTSLAVIIHHYDALIVYTTYDFTSCDNLSLWCFNCVRNYYYDITSCHNSSLWCFNCVHNYTCSYYDTAIPHHYWCMLKICKHVYI